MRTTPITSADIMSDWESLVSYAMVTGEGTELGDGEIFFDGADRFAVLRDNDFQILSRSEAFREFIRWNVPPELLVGALGQPEEN